MKKILLAALGFLGVVTVSVIGLLQAGTIDVAADKPYSPAIHRFIVWAREQSIARRTVNLVPPTDLTAPDRTRRGAGNYDAMCANCHLSPGSEDSEIRKGLYPIPPNLSKPANVADSNWADVRRFWIIKHGIKASGMPAWSKGGMEDEAIWDLTAFLKIMPSLSPEAYRRQVEASSGHVHGGLEKHGDEKESQPDAGHAHDTKAHSHKHGVHKH
jgi:mono/diheme cytochrome c family protein